MNATQIGVENWIDFTLKKSLVRMLFRSEQSRNFIVRISFCEFSSRQSTRAIGKSALTNALLLWGALNDEIVNSSFQVTETLGGKSNTKTVTNCTMQNVKQDSGDEDAVPPKWICPKSGCLHFHRAYSGLVWFSSCTAFSLVFAFQSAYCLHYLPLFSCPMAITFRALRFKPELVVTFSAANSWEGMRTTMVWLHIANRHIKCAWKCIFPLNFLGVCSFALCWNFN